MPVVGLVVNLAFESRAADLTLRKMTDAACLTLGPAPEPGRIPVVLETETDAESRQQLRWLNDLPGVIEVQVVTADFSDLSPLETQPPLPEPPPSDPAGPLSEPPPLANPRQPGAPGPGPPVTAARL